MVGIAVVLLVVVVNVMVVVWLRSSKPGIKRKNELYSRGTKIERRRGEKGNGTVRVMAGLRYSKRD